MATNIHFALTDQPQLNFVAGIVSITTNTSVLSSYPKLSQAASAPSAAGAAL
jgi:hypothetical protein